MWTLVSVNYKFSAWTFWFDYCISVVKIHYQGLIDIYQSTNQSIDHLSTFQMMSYTLVLLPVSMGTLRYNNHSFIQQRFMEHLLPARNEHWTKWQKLCLSLCSGSGIKTTNKRNKQNIYIWRKIKQVRGKWGWFCGKGSCNCK